MDALWDTARTINGWVSDIAEGCLLEEAEVVDAGGADIHRGMMVSFHQLRRRA